MRGTRKQQLTHIDQREFLGEVAGQKPFSPADFEPSLQHRGKLGLTQRETSGYSNSNRTRALSATSTICPVLNSYALDPFQCKKQESTRYDSLLPVPLTPQWATPCSQQQQKKNMKKAVNRLIAMEHAPKGHSSFFLFRGCFTHNRTIYPNSHPSSSPPPLPYLPALSLNLRLTLSLHALMPVLPSQRPHIYTTQLVYHNRHPPISWSIIPVYKETSHRTQWSLKYCTCISKVLAE